MAFVDEFQSLPTAEVLLETVANVSHRARAYFFAVPRYCNNSIRDHPAEQITQMKYASYTMNRECALEGTLENSFIEFSESQRK